MADSRFTNPEPSSSCSTLAPLLRRALSFIPTGVAVLSNDQVTMTVSSLHCVSFEPPMVSVALARESAKGVSILERKCFRAQLLQHGEENLARGEGILSGPALLRMDCSVTAIFPAGDHHLVLATVEQASISHGYPLVYWRRGLHAFQPRYTFLTSRVAFQEFMARLEDCTLPKSQWTHAAHVAVGASYAVQFTGTAFERTKSGILRYNESIGTVNGDHSGYHETLTRLWSLIFAKVTKGFSDPWEAACHAARILGEDRDLHHLYYSFDIIRNVQARRTWVPPDLQGPY